MENLIKYISENNWIDLILDNNIPEFIFTVIITLILAKLATKALNKLLAKIDNSSQDKTNYYFFRYVLIALIYTIGFTLAIYSIPAFKTIGTTILAGAGVFALAFSFASQQALSNIVSGIFIITFKPFKIRDRITMKSQGYEGVIEDITLRHTVIRDYENRRIIVPNSVISDETIINSDYSECKICKHLIFNISYDSNIGEAKKIIAEEALKHPLTFDNRSDTEKENNTPVVLIRVIGLGESSVDLKAFVWVEDHKRSLEVASDLYESIKLRFDEAGISIPYPHQTIELIQKTVS